MAVESRMAAWVAELDVGTFSVLPPTTAAPVWRAVFMPSEAGRRRMLPQTFTSSPILLECLKGTGWPIPILRSMHSSIRATLN